MSMLRMDTDRIADLIKSLDGTIVSLTGEIKTVQQRVGGLSSFWKGASSDEYGQLMQMLMSKVGTLSDDVALMRKRLDRELVEWEAAARSLGVSTESVASIGLGYDAASPVGIGSSGGSDSGGEAFSLIDAERGLEDLLRNTAGALSNLRWVIDLPKMERIFDDLMVKTGRLLNRLTESRGYIKEFSELGSELKWLGKVAGVVQNLFLLKDQISYLKGELTNSEMAGRIGEAIPIPIVSDKIGQWLRDNVVSPDGHWNWFMPEPVGESDEDLQRFFSKISPDGRSAD